MDILTWRIWLPLIGFVLGAVLAAWWVLVHWLDRGRVETTVVTDLSIRVDHLPPTGPLPRGPGLTIYGIPVRLAVLVIAPLGRGTELRPEQLPSIVDQLLPRLHPLLGYHQPEFRQWPPQLSVQGFQHAFFTQVRLPGDHGKNSAWSGLAGRFTADGRPYLAGLVCCAEQPNGLGQIFVQHEGQWLDVLRIKESS